MDTFAGRYFGTALKLVAPAALLFVSLFAWTGSAEAGWSSPPTQLSAAAGAGAEAPSAAVDNAGNSAYTWLAGGGDVPVMFNQIAAGAEPVAGTAIELTDPGSTGDSPDIAMSTDGKGIVAWIADDGDVLGSRFEAGETPSDPIVIASRAGWTAAVPQVSIAADGDAFVTFTYTTEVPAPASVVSGVHIPAGGPPGAIVDLSTPAMSSSEPGVDVDGDGRFHLVWTEDDAGVGAIRGRTIADGGTLGDSFAISEDTGSASSPTIATNSDGASIVAFSQAGAPTGALKTVRVAADDTVANAQVFVSAAVTALPTVGIADDGSAIAAGFVVGLPGGLGVYASKIPANGSPTTPELVSTGGVPGGWKVGVDARGNSVISLYGPIEAGGSFLQTAIYTPAGADFGELVVLDPNDSATAYGFDMSRSGQAVVGWNGFGDGEPGSYEGMMAARFAAEADVSPGTLEFGSMDVGRSSTKLVNVTNSGGSPLRISSVGASGPASGDYAVTATPCTDAAVPVGATCSIEVTFTPSAPGVRAGTLTLSSDSTSAVDPIVLSGSGNQPIPPPTPRAKVKISKVSPRTFKARRGTSRVIKVRVTNTGDATATGVKVCPRLSPSAMKKLRVGKCAGLARVAGGSSKTASVRVTVKRSERVKGKTGVKVRLMSRNGGGGTERVFVNIPR
ncbi:MAG TPA: choice-of-anchor D domain-containing protein [Solirubrobacterales bacterium]|nr:choice-of-anchor D domain-containing protein [Solirubrobacterales bacterium]